jgi:hypothetical protein
MDFKKGTCEATHEMIVGKTGFARATVHRHITALRDMGWLDWVRRSVKAEDGSSRPTANGYFSSQPPAQRGANPLAPAVEQGHQDREHADRKGSGPTPNRVQRLAERLAKGYSGAVERLREKTAETT